MKNLEFKLKQEFTLFNLKNFISTDVLRPIMSRVYLDIENKCLVATNAWILVVYPIEIIENDTDLKGVNISPTVFNYRAYRNSNKCNKMMSFSFTLSIDEKYNQLIEVFDEFRRSIYMERNKEIEGKFPDYKAVLPKKMHEIRNDELFPLQGFIKPTHVLDPNLYKHCINAIKTANTTMVIDNYSSVERKDTPTAIYFYNSEKENICTVMIMGKSGF